MKLSEFLLSLGFFPALGTVECIGLPGSSAMVTKREPNRYDSNNGTFVIYDETGSPWVKSNKLIDANEWESIQRFPGLERGSYVPHSNDGGDFMGGILPRLLAGERAIEIHV